MAYKEIVTKAVIGKGKKKYKNSYKITVENNPTTVLGCWIINHHLVGGDNRCKIDSIKNFLLLRHSKNSL